MSPLKRFNKVAPVSGKPTSTPLNLEENTTPLKSSSASLLEQKAEDTGRQRTRERPDSAPQKREDPTRRQQLPIDVNVVVKANQPAPTGMWTLTTEQKSNDLDGKVCGNAAEPVVIVYHSRLSAS